MNRTDDDPQTETDVMATAFSTMRKYGMNIRSACGHALQLRRLLPVTMTLSAIGAEMERREEISVLPCEDYAQKALARLTVQYLSTGGNK